jgi:hypothetical protein
MSYSQEADGFAADGFATKEAKAYLSQITVLLISC